jgi:Reverse transcriptase (RNA-dependent DNA polymerase)
MKEVAAIFVASLDAAKAFDRVNHFKLYTTLIRAGLPIYFVNTIINWYSKLCISVRWNTCESSFLPVRSGVRQGGILSPSLFNVYVNDIVVTLRKLDAGCHIRNTFVGCIMYADDILLLSASVIELQSMLDVCGDVGNNLGIMFNASKSMCMCIGRYKPSIIATMLINGSELQWVDQIKYLGITVVAGKAFMVDLKETRRKFFSSVNTIMSKCKYVSDIVKLELFEAHCLPILLYAVESLNPTAVLMKEMNSWWNAVYRKIFGYHKWESVKAVIYQLRRLDLLHIINSRQIMFIKRVSCSMNSVMSALASYYMNGRQLKALQDVYGLQIAWSAAKIKALSYASFAATCEQ